VYWGSILSWFKTAVNHDVNDGFVRALTEKCLGGKEKYTTGTLLEYGRGKKSDSKIGMR